MQQGLKSKRVQLNSVKFHLTLFNIGDQEVFKSVAKTAQLTVSSFFQGK